MERGPSIWKCVSLAECTLALLPSYFISLRLLYTWLYTSTVATVIEELLEFNNKRSAAVTLVSVEIWAQRQEEIHSDIYIAI